MMWKRLCGCGRCFSWLAVLCPDIQDRVEKVAGTREVSRAGQGHCWAVALQQELAQEEMVWETGVMDATHVLSNLSLPSGCKHTSRTGKGLPFPFLICRTHCCRAFC